MQKYRIVAVMLGGLFLASPAMAQSTNLAYATGEPRSEYHGLPREGQRAARVRRSRW